MVFFQWVWVGFFQCTFSLSFCPLSLCPFLLILSEVLVGELRVFFAIPCKVKDENLSKLNFTCCLAGIDGIWELYRLAAYYCALFTASQMLRFCKLKAPAKHYDSLYCDTLYCGGLETEPTVSPRYAYSQEKVFLLL